MTEYYSRPGNGQQTPSAISGIAIGSALCVLAWIAWSAFEIAWISITLVALGIIVLVVYLAIPSSRPMIVSTFEAITYPVRWIATLVVLAIVYFLVLLPVAIWYRASGKSILRRSPDATSNWVPYESPDEPDSYFKAF